MWHMRSLLFTEPVDYLIGNTYGKYLERDTGNVPLIRLGFPIFDRHHYHRLPDLGLRRRTECAGLDTRQDLRRNRPQHQCSVEDRL
jgi:nitrogenase molybdenum-iron protein alpha/beta subunit